jgi:hypothetical protein
MRLSRLLWWIVPIAIAVAFLWPRIRSHRHTEMLGTTTVPDLSVTSPLNKSGGGTAPVEAYEIYSALYQAPMQEPLVFSQDSVTDIPQVNGSCLKPATPEEREMTDAFEAANQHSHRWEQRFSIRQGYRLLSRHDASEVQSCIETHGADARRCASYGPIKHVRFLGVPGVDHTHTRALVSVIKMCGSFCGSGGIFEVEKADGTWRRTDTTDFTRNCSWMY